MHKNQSPAHLLSLVAVLLFTGTQFGWLPWVEKGACLQDIILSISSDCESDDPALLFGMGLPPCEYKPPPPGPSLSPGKSLQSRIHPFAPYEGLKSRAPPTLLSN
jgi:hypothetical protein